MILYKPSFWCSCHVVDNVHNVSCADERCNDEEDHQEHIENLSMSLKRTMCGLILSRIRRRGIYKYMFAVANTGSKGNVIHKRDCCGYNRNHIGELLRILNNDPRESRTEG
jgi:hypothetical protein